ncbi:MAG TPA: hypothetical protein VEK33_20855 [Terriglobales bacterium]|nr:hypothetical protein [Terriglobales bacterium]
MFRRVSLVFVLLAAVPLWCQQEDSNATPSASSSSADDARMATPPPVSGAAYPTETISESRSNYVRGGLTFNSTYTDNLLGGGSTKPVSDISYSVWPIIALDQVTPRLHAVLTYSPGFTFYQHTSSYNQQNQNVDIDFRYRLSPHLTLSLRDTLHKLSNVFNQPDLLASSPVSGSAQSPTVGVVAPLANQLNNTGNVELTYQFARDSMVGASGVFYNLDFTNPGQVKGLFDSASRGGSAFYSHRLAKKHYIGAAYQYQQILAYPTVGQSQLQTQTAFLFYTVFLRPTLSMSFSGGPQHSDIVQPAPSSESWSPAGTASFGWQARHTVVSGIYSRMVSGGGGLIGAYHSNNAALSLRQQFTRNWNAGVTGGYSIYKTVDPVLSLFNEGGHTVTGSASLERRFGEHWDAALGYTRLHQSYSDIAAVAVFPNVNREWISITYQFARPLGR